MIITRLKFTNICSFSEADINLSYPRKLQNSPLDGENLYGRDKFYYRKVCIITGANASGKTSLGRMMLGIQHFLVKKNFHPTSFPINNKEKSASFEVDFATEDFIHHRLFLKFKIDKNEICNLNELKYTSVRIGENDSCAKTTKLLDSIFERKSIFNSGVLDISNSYLHSVSVEDQSCSIEDFKKFSFTGGWFYLLSETNETTTAINSLDKNIFEMIMKTFDPSIKSVLELKETQENTEEEDILTGYSIRFNNNDNVIVTKTGDVANAQRLSKGTFDAVKLSNFVSSLTYDSLYEHPQNCMTYFLDERMAYVHSELERAMITLIISKLKSNTQFFYTTHNSDIFKLDLPIHSYIFIKKIAEQSTFIDATSILKKNDRNLARYVENDVFGVLPDLSKLEALI
ncbi:ATP-binding protein [Leclercia adecarboxylata]|uniref:ATP-binding protein n=1 Tax=Leclercia adecarboxylata TaxID=83655 RepID=UPI00384CB96D